jgi:predicted N-acyltransferase
MYNAVLYDTIDEVSQEEWDSILPEEDIFNRYSFLKILADSRINDCRYRYLVIHDTDGSIAATASLYTISTDLATMLVTGTQNWLTAVRRLFPRFLMYRVTECGSPVATGNAVTIAEHKRQDTGKLIAILADELTRFSREQSAPLILARDFYRDQEQVHDSFKRAGYRKAVNFPSVILNCRWKSFDDYTAALKYSYRRALKNCMKSIHRGDLQVRVTGSFSDYARELHALYMQCYTNAREYQREILTERFFAETGSKSCSNCSTLLLEHDNTIEGFALLFEQSGHLKLLFLGYNYESNSVFSTYFNIFYATLRYALDNGMKTIDFGVTSYDFKLRLGGQAVDLFAHIKHKNRVTNSLLSRIIPFLFPEHRNDPRHPFNAE